jgi:serine/threonine protein kinase/tetratricopeptide (TPR) repeat protein
MGEVYRARDPRLGREVAIKVLPPGDERDEHARSRLAREARTASQLNHPHICTIYEVGEVEGLAYIAMERVEGHPLSLLLGPGGLPWETVVRYGIQLADALSYAHERGVIHRDLKSANVVVTDDGRVKVLDFGLARRVGSLGDVSEAPTQTLTMPGIIAGTLQYLAPEILRGGAADPRTDLWSLGVMLHEMASGTRPFQGATGVELGFAILNNPPEPLPARVPAGLARVVERCLAKDPAQRFRQAGEVRAALESLSHEAAVERRSGGMVRRQTGSLRTIYWATPAIVLLLAGLALFDVGGLRSRLTDSAGKDHIPSIAVLPLVNYSHDPTQEYFADSMTEELIATLAQIGALRVISRTSVMGLKDTKKSMREIGRLLDVDAIFEGSVQRSGDRVRITAQLIRAASDEHIWARTYERDMRDVLALQAEVAAAIASEVHVQLTARQQRRIAGAPVSPRAYELYLRGVDAFHRWEETSMRAALEFFGQALAIDSTYAPAWAMLALVEFHRSAESDEQDAAARARQSAARALRLDPELGLAHAVTGTIAGNLDWDWGTAEREFRRAIELTPSSFDAHHSYSHLLMKLGRVDESFEHSRIAAALDPLNTAATLHMGWHYLFAGHLEMAIAEYKATLRLDPSYGAAYAQLSWVYTLTGRYDEATAAYRKRFELNRTSADTLLMSALIAARRGRTQEALHGASSMIQAANRGKRNAVEVATVFAWLGREDEAFQWLDRAVQNREAAANELKLDPFLEGLRSDPRFPALLQRMGLPVGPPSR